MARFVKSKSLRDAVAERFLAVTFQNAVGSVTMLDELNPYAPPKTASMIRHCYIRCWRSASYVLIWTLAIACLFYVGTFPDGYRIHVLHETPRLDYPWAGVFLTAGLMVSQAIVVYMLLRPESYAWNVGRSLAAFGFQAFTFVIFSFGSMHSPPTYDFFLFWMLICSLSLLIMSVLAITISVITSTSKET